MFHRYLIAEILKLRRSLVVFLCLAAPVCVTVMCVLIGLRGKAASPLANYWMTGAAFWAFAMLPLSVTALSVLMAQMEHGPRTWDHLLAMPGARNRLFLAKAVIMFGLVAIMTVLVGAMLVLGGYVLDLAKPVTGMIDLPVGNHVRSDVAGERADVRAPALDGAALSQLRAAAAAWHHRHLFFSGRSGSARRDLFPLADAAAYAVDGPGDADRRASDRRIGWAGWARGNAVPPVAPRGLTQPHRERLWPACRFSQTE